VIHITPLGSGTYLPDLSDSVWSGLHQPARPPSLGDHMGTLTFTDLDLDFPAGSRNKTATLATGEQETVLVDAGFTRADGHRGKPKAWGQAWRQP